MEDNNRKLVLGGGISGLTCAHALRKQGADVTLLESQEHLGGAIQTHVQGGYLTELGPNTLQVSTRTVDEFISQLGLESEVVRPNPEASKRYVVRNNRLHAVPAGLLSGLTTRLFRFSGKLRLLGDLFVRKYVSDQDESLADFVRRRIGREFLDYAINPMVGGVYAGDPERLSVKHAFPKVYRLEKEFGGLIKGAFRIRGDKQRDTEAIPTKMVSFREGMVTLPEKLQEILGECVVKGVHIDSLSQQSGRWQVVWRRSDGERVTGVFDSVVLAVPAYAIPGLPWPTELRSEMQFFRQVEYPPVASVSLGFDRQRVRHPLDGFGMLIPEKERRSILGTLFSSSMFTGRAEQGKVNLTTFVGGSRQPELALSNQQDLRDLVVRDISELLEITGRPEYCNIAVWRQAIPQYNIGYGSVLNAIDELERKWQGLHFCGNYRTGISVEKCILGGLELATKMLQADEKVGTHPSDRIRD